MRVTLTTLRILVAVVADPVVASVVGRVSGSIDIVVVATVLPDQKRPNGCRSSHLHSFALMDHTTAYMRE